MNANLKVCHLTWLPERCTYLLTACCLFYSLLLRACPIEPWHWASANKCLDPETEMAKWNSDIINVIIFFLLWHVRKGLHSLQEAWQQIGNFFLLELKYSVKLDSWISGTLWQKHKINVLSGQWEAAWKLAMRSRPEAELALIPGGLTKEHNRWTLA